MKFEDIKVGEQFYWCGELYKKLNEKQAKPLSFHANNRDFGSWEIIHPNPETQKSSVWVVEVYRTDAPKDGRSVVSVHMTEESARKSADTINEELSKHLYNMYKYSVREMELYND